MMTRRQFMMHGALAVLGVAVAPTLADAPRERVPDGSASKGMITPAAERSIELGLAYLSSQQQRDGCFGTNTYRGNVAVTSLAALAMMAGGHLPGRGPYGKVVTDALKFVLSKESKNRNPGFLYYPDEAQHGPMYGHGFGTLFLAEVCGMVHDPDLRGRVKETLGKAVSLILNSQNSTGGWRYHPQSTDADISVTVCQIMALRSAQRRLQCAEIERGQVCRIHQEMPGPSGRLVSLHGSGRRRS